jgi:deoxyribodipyrimidine photo-lyase
MTHTYHRSLFIFRQDLRLDDNNGLIKACHKSDEIIPIFIFDTNIINTLPKLDKRLWFLIDAIQELDLQLRKKGSYLSIYYGDPEEIIPDLVKKHGINALYWNESYGKGAVSRDAQMSSRCRENSIACNITRDYMLVPIDSVPVRKVFTPFYKLRTKHIEAHPIVTQNAPAHIHSPKIDISLLQWIIQNLSYEKNTSRDIHFPIDRVESFSFEQYADTRNIPSLDGSSRLSPYIRFGLISIRRLYLHAKKHGAESYISELAWREFWNHIFFHFPETRSQEFQEKRRNIQRENNLEHFEARKNGMTGYPMVDAGMRQLKAENRMHGRVRMVVASFLTKDLLIDRRWGEKHFSDYLIDYDTNVNVGNRQWSASVWADPKPLRIFSPMLQSERFDPDCIYIKKWIPELAHYSPKEIHAPLENNLDYAKPIVDHYIWSKKAKERYYESWDENKSA